MIGAGVLVGVALAYLSPALIAARRRRPDAGDILLANVLWAWTVVGWFCCLIRALRRPEPPSASALPLSQEERAWASVADVYAPWFAMSSDRLS